MPVMLVCACGSALAQSDSAHSRDHHQHDFSDAARWSQRFDDPQRDAWQKPAEIIRTLALKADAVVADIGAGTGYLATRLARALTDGRVFAIDSEAAMVRFLNERARREHLPNLLPIQAGENDPRIPGMVDVIVLLNTYHHIPERRRYFAELRAKLLPGGRLVIIDYRLDAPMGPPKNARIAPERVVAELEGAGYTLGKDHPMLPHQYFLEFTRAPR
jgi:SAM-dependent methyltransferase